MLWGVHAYIVGSSRVYSYYACLYYCTFVSTFDGMFWLNCFYSFSLLWFANKMPFFLRKSKGEKKEIERKREIEREADQIILGNEKPTFQILCNYSSVTVQRKDKNYDCKMSKNVALIWNIYRVLKKIFNILVLCPLPPLLPAFGCDWSSIITDWITDGRADRG